MEYSPKITPELTLIYYYQAAEQETRLEPGCYEEIEISEILIHGQEISEDLTEDLLNLHGEDWEAEILNKIKTRNMEDIGEARYERRLYENSYA